MPAIGKKAVALNGIFSGTEVNILPAVLLSMIDALLTEPPLTKAGDMTKAAVYNKFIEINGEEV